MTSTTPEALYNESAGRDHRLFPPIIDGHIKKKGGGKNHPRPVSALLPNDLVVYVYRLFKRAIMFLTSAFASSSSIA